MRPRHDGREMALQGLPRHHKDREVVDSCCHVCLTDAGQFILQASLISHVDQEENNVHMQLRGHTLQQPLHLLATAGPQLLSNILLPVGVTARKHEDGVNLQVIPLADMAHIQEITASHWAWWIKQ